MTPLSRLKALVERWRKGNIISEVDGYRYTTTYEAAQHDCADELESVLAQGQGEAEPVAWMNPSDHDTGFTREKPEDMTGWYPLWTIPRFGALDELVERWFKEANEQPGELAFQMMGVQMRICANMLKDILKSPLFRPFHAAHPPSSEATAEQGEPTLAWLQQNLPWTIPYSPEFEASAEVNPERRVSHDVLHVMKSLGRIAAACESADHAREPKTIEWHKEVADLVICALHIAKLKSFSLEDAVIDCSGTRNNINLRAALAPPLGSPGADVERQILDDYKAGKISNLRAIELLADFIEHKHVGQPKDWVLVPREPTEAMMKAAYAAQGGVNNQIRAAIAAAPDSAGKQ